MNKREMVGKKKSKNWIDTFYWIIFISIVHINVVLYIYILNIYIYKIYKYALPEISILKNMTFYIRDLCCRFVGFSFVFFGCVQAAPWGVNIVCFSCWLLLSEMLQHQKCNFLLYKKTKQKQQKKKKQFVSLNYKLYIQ